MPKIPAKLNQLFKGFAKLIAPPPDLTVSQWADAYRKLSREDSSEPGQWRTSRAPFQKEPMDAINDPHVETIVLMWASQTGKTALMMNVMGFFVDYDPAPIMLVQPTITMAEAFSKDRLAPMIRDNPTIKDKVHDVKSKDSGNTILHKRFPGGSITMSGANSPASLASRPIRIVMMDEIDRFPESAGTEGDPVNLATARSETFWNKKRILISTPTVMGASRIDFAYENSTMEQWHLPCPECEEPQPLIWKGIEFDFDEKANRIKSVAYRCQHCGMLSTEHEWKSGAGTWVARKDHADTRGFHLNALASHFVSWSRIVNKFREATRGGKEMLKTFFNTVMAEAWEETGEKLDDEMLYQRREDYGEEIDVPSEAVLLTAGVDTQDNRLEVEVVGWGAGKESWGIQYHIIPGNPALPEIWQELDTYLDRQWKRADGSSAVIAAACIDSGGHHTTEVYKYCKRREHRRIFAIKGEGGPGKPIIAGHSRTKREKCLLVRVGVDAGKERITSNLKLEEWGPGYCHFPDAADKGYSEQYFRGLTAERKVLRYYKGQPRYEWQKTTARNEPLDLRNYAMAALEIVKPNLDALPPASGQSLGAPKKPKRKRGTISKGL
jgi:phage terminase large subunit GpA-like protein